MWTYRVAASSTHSRGDSSWVGTEIAGRTRRAVVQPLTSFQATECGSVEKSRTKWTVFIVHIKTSPTISPRVADSSCIIIVTFCLIIFTHCCWESAHNYCLRWARWRFGGGLLTKRALRTNQTVLPVPVTHLQAVGARRTWKLSAICSTWWCNTDSYSYSHDSFLQVKKRNRFYQEKKCMQKCKEYQ